ncbi:hypothetical protein MAM1_0333d09777 [Mucor ambiguus]|uniref:Uncharacterized protein n=1 Tax=Mucor ambiguus TaxID=91626 RepID=A0A0C9MS17_9FUNG|nr:hypothetical protein MAM1_0333d09777 [Mucor ambiguus]
MRYSLLKIKVSIVRLWHRNNNIFLYNIDIVAYFNVAYTHFKKIGLIHCKCHVDAPDVIRHLNLQPFFFSVTFDECLNPQMMGDNGHCHLSYIHFSAIMLNPLAHDFTPISAFSPERPSSQQMKSPPPPKRKEELSKKKQAKSKIATTTTNTSSTSTSTSTAKGKKKDSQANSKKQQQQHRDSKSKHRNTKTAQGIHNHATTVTTTATPSDLFAKESKFITIEAAIDPIRRIKEVSHANGLQHRRQSTNNDTYQFEHGYEQYIDWIDRSLRLFDTVTLVGMDNAVVDVVSLVTILQSRRIGVHDGNLSS